jgi:penicillin-binding protein 1A
VAAIDNGYSPNYMLPDTAFVYRDPRTGQVWAPRNVGAVGDGYKSLAEGLATSDNIVTARVITQLVDPAAVAFYARRMGVKSRLDQVPSLALGVSDVSLLEMTAAYSTLANGGLYHEPTVITRIEDRFGNVLYESLPNPQEALSESTAYTVVDMMRGAIQYGTAQRIRFQFGLGDYDLAGKTGTTQESADGWFMLMHPDLVTGAWVGFNDRRIQFRSIAWGQGGRNALLLVGDFMQRAARAQNSHISQTRFPSAVDYGRQEALPVDEDGATREREVTPPDNDRRVGW